MLVFDCGIKLHGNGTEGKWKWNQGRKDSKYKVVCYRVGLCLQKQRGSLWTGHPRTPIFLLALSPSCTDPSWSSRTLRTLTPLPVGCHHPSEKKVQILHRMVCSSSEFRGGAGGPALQGVTGSGLGT